MGETCWERCPLSTFILSTFLHGLGCQGVPVHLKEEFIYRNPSHLHVSEFQGLMLRSIEMLVESGVEVTISNTNTINPNHHDSAGVIIFLTSVKPVYRAGEFSRITTY